MFYLLYLRYLQLILAISCVLLSLLITNLNISLTMAQCSRISASSVGWGRAYSTWKCSGKLASISDLLSAMVMFRILGTACPVNFRKDTAEASSMSLVMSLTCI